MNWRPGVVALSLWLGVSGPAAASLYRLDNLFVFGDSLSDSGNSGIISRTATAGLPGGPITFPPPPYFDGRYSNGPVAVEYLWNSYNPGNPGGFRPSLDPGGGTNYAVGGATSGVANFNAVNDSVPAVLQPVLRPAFTDKAAAWQLAEFLADGPGFRPSNSLFVVWFGANDLFYAADPEGGSPGNVPGASPSANLVENAINNILATIGTLYGEGARRFLVPNLPDLGLTPEFIGTSAAPAASAYSQGFNLFLSLALDAIKPTLASAEVVLFDLEAALNGLIANAADYGISVTDRACVANFNFADPMAGACNPGNWNTWLFWDGVHPTTRTHQILAGQLRAAVPEPGVLLLLPFGLAVALVLRRRGRALIA